MMVATALNGVSRERKYSPQPIPSRILSRKNDDEPFMEAALALAMVLLLLLDLVAPLRERVEPHEQRGPERHHEGRGAQRAGHQLGVGPIRHAGVERQLLEGDVRDVEPAGPAGLVLAV